MVTTEVENKIEQIKALLFLTAARNVLRCSTARESSISISNIYYSKVKQVTIKEYYFKRTTEFNV